MAELGYVRYSWTAPASRSSEAVSRKPSGSDVAGGWREQLEQSPCIRWPGTLTRRPVRPLRRRNRRTHPRESSCERPAAAGRVARTQSTNLAIQRFLSRIALFEPAACLHPLPFATLDCPFHALLLSPTEHASHEVENQQCRAMVGGSTNSYSLRLSFRSSPSGFAAANIACLTIETAAPPVSLLRLP